MIVLVLTERPGKPIRQKRESLPNQSGPFLLGNPHFFQEQVLFIPDPVRGRHCLAEKLCKQSFILQVVSKGKIAFIDTSVMLANLQQDKFPPQLFPLDKLFFNVLQH